MANYTRREALKLATAAVTLLPTTVQASATAALAPTALTPLPLGAIKPSGWLHDQLQIQADGMGGHLDEHWPDVGPNSAWLGGTGEAWERGPYFLDGLLPLSVLLDDPTLRAKANRWIEWTVTHPQPNGMIGPAKNDDWWPRMVMVKCLAQHYDTAQDPRILPILTNYFHHQLETMPTRPLRDWGKFRWQDEVLIVQWLYDHTHDAKLLDLATLLQQQGFDWQAGFANFPFKDPTDQSVLKAGGTSDHALQAHGVNNGQALKVAAVQYRMTGERAQHDALLRQIDTLDRYHGLPNGMFSCDEHLSGHSPSQGSELCTVVESMYSLEVAFATFGDASLGDRIERLAFNCLPGTFTDDMWAHQYDQQPNQIQVSVGPKPFSTNGDTANLYGLEPWFGCCTANFHQGWPKFAVHLWMRTPDHGLAATLYAPCTVNTNVQGKPVHIQVATEYPFRDTIHMTVNPTGKQRFPIHLRIPGWAADATITINGKPANVEASPNTFARIDREWRPNDRIELCFPMQPRLTRWYANSAAIERGPLLFALAPDTRWTKLRDYGYTADWQVTATSPWNYALAVNEATAPKLSVEEHPLGRVPFGSKTPAVTIKAPALSLKEWTSKNGVADPPPQIKVARVGDPIAMLTLVPYASAKLRVTAFPTTGTT